MYDPAIGLVTVDARRGVHGATGETGLDRFRLAARALPGRDLDAVVLRTRLLGAELAAPVIVAAEDGAAAREAAAHGVGLVSNRHAPERPPLWLAAVDATDLCGGAGPAGAERLVCGLEADGLVVRLNGLDEALRRDGQPRMGGAAEAIASAAERLAPLPVVACGTGRGVDPADVRELRAAGVAALCVGGRVDGWGVPTADGLAEAALTAPDLPLLATVADGVDAAKALALGATAVHAVTADLAGFVRALRVAVWAAGVPAPGALTPGHLRDA